MLQPLWRLAIDGVLIVLGASALVFLVLQLAPGDPLVLAQGDPRMDPAARAAWARGFEASAPLWQRWWHFASAAMQGDFGWSWSQQRPVLHVLASTMPYTVALTLPALLLAVCMGVVVGSSAALVPRAVVSRGTLSVLRLISGVPPVWIALMLLVVFAVAWPVLPMQGVCNPRNCAPIAWTTPFTLLERLRYAILPWSSLAIALAPLFARVQYRAALSAVRAPHVVAAKARGLPPRRVLLRHALRVTWLPLLSTVSLSVPLLAGGALFVERVFGWPGMGAMLLQAVNSRDYPLVAVTTMIFAGVTVAAVSLTELVASALDPRPAGGDPA